MKTQRFYFCITIEIGIFMQRESLNCKKYDRSLSVQVLPIYDLCTLTIS